MSITISHKSKTVADQIKGDSYLLQENATIVSVQIILQRNVFLISFAIGVKMDHITQQTVNF